MLLEEYVLEVKKSKFYAYLYEINNLEEINEILNKIKKEHKKARHIPYAYNFNNNSKKSDDKEPSGTAGLPIYNVIEKSNLKNKLLVIVRYFGGIKLGAGGLFRAYSNAASEVIKKWNK